MFYSIYVKKQSEGEVLQCCFFLLLLFLSASVAALLVFTCI